MSRNKVRILAHSLADLLVDLLLPTIVYLLLAPTALSQIVRLSIGGYFVAAKAFATAPEAQPAVPPAALPEVAQEPEPATASDSTTASGIDANEVPEGVTAFEILSDDSELVGGVACPVDPMERLQCESCQ